MAVAINRLAGALCFNNGDSVEERMREFLAVSDIVLKCFYDVQSCFPSLKKAIRVFGQTRQKGTCRILSYLFTSSTHTDCEKVIMKRVLWNVECLAVAEHFLMKWDDLFP